MKLNHLMYKIELIATTGLLLSMTFLTVWLIYKNIQKKRMNL